MRRILQSLIVALAAFGLAAGSALAQKAEPTKDATKKSATATKDATKKAADAPSAKAEAPKSAEPMDINSASESELAMLKGIGPVRAKAIVKGRPYMGKDELAQKKIVPQNVYDDIKEQIIAKQGTAKKAPAKKKA
jgi:DNA uptake protein ComE-like DNA-binding protein